MNSSFFKWWMLAIPGAVFVLVLITILLKLPSPETNSIENPLSSPEGQSSIDSVLPGKTELELLNKQIVEFKIDDSQLASPNFDRKISLPKE